MTPSPSPQTPPSALPSIAEQLTAFDYLIFLVIVAGTYAAVIWGRSRKKSSERTAVDILMDGRRLTLPFFIATLVATWYGGVLGVTQISYESGIYNFVTQGVFWYVSYVIFAFAIAPRLKKTASLTLPELSHQFFGARAQRVAAVFNIFNVIPTTYAISIGLIINTWTGIGLLPGIVIGVSAVLGYSLLGGFRSIIISDLIQFAVMVSAILAVLFFSIFTYGGWGFLTSELPSTHFEPTGNHSIGELVMWGFIALSTLVDPNFYHRVFAAKDQKVAKKGILISVLIWLVIDIGTTAGGMYAAAVIKNADSSSAYLYYGLSVLPSPLKGFFLAGLVATIFSTLDSYLFLASSTMSYDIQGRRKNFLSSYRINLITFAALSITLGYLFTSGLPGAGGIKDVWKTFGSYSAGALMLPLLAGFAGWSFFREKDFLWATGLAALGITIWRLKDYLWLLIGHDLLALAGLPGVILYLEELYIGLLLSSTVLLVAYVRHRHQLSSEGTLKTHQT